MGILCVGHAADQRGDRQHSGRYDRKQMAKQEVRQGTQGGEQKEEQEIGQGAQNK